MRRRSGFSALEIEWQYSDGWHIPKAVTFRPQSWFICPWRDRNVLHLRDGSAEGAELWPCGWIVHTHKSRSGWLPRAGLFRVLAWTYLIRAYAASSEVQYVQIHGLPLRLGKYPPGSTDADKTALLNALRCLGQDAAGIIPVGMEVIFQSPTANTRDIPRELVTRCEQGMSKAILGGTLTSQADGKTSTNALGEIHEQVRRDILSADARQIAATLTEQLLRPLAMLNLGITDRRALPWWQFDTQDAADLALYAEALPKLAPYMRISRRYVHERLKLPEAVSEDDVFQTATTPPEPEGEDAGHESASANIAAKTLDGSAQAHAATQALESMHAEEALTAAGESLLRPLLDELANGLTPEELQGRLANLYPRMDAGELADILARAMFVAEVWGRVSAND